jgi:hypothetical protein
MQAFFTKPFAPQAGAAQASEAILSVTTVPSGTHPQAHMKKAYSDTSPTTHISVA